MQKVGELNSVLVGSLLSTVTGDREHTQEHVLDDQEHAKERVPGNQEQFSGDGEHAREQIRKHIPGDQEHVPCD